MFSDECSVPTISIYLFYSHLFTENSKAKVKYKLEIWLQTPSQSGIDKINTDEKEKKEKIRQYDCAVWTHGVPCSNYL